MEVSLGPGFLPSLDGLAPAATSRVLRAVQRFQANPSSPGLNFEKLKGRAGARRLWTFRASQSLRVLVAYEGAVVLVLSAGEHQAVYALADNSAFIVRRTGAIGLVRANDSDGSAGDTARPRVDTGPIEDLGPSILEHWTNSELLRVGFDEAEVDVLRDARDEESLLERWSNADKLDLVIDCMERSPEQFFQPGMLNDGGATDFRNAIVERGALSGLSSLLNAEEFARLLEGPIEEWMLFLHPEQRAIVDRNYSGPARVRGSAGTGKTVVAIHRAAALASRHAAPTRPTVLFTTFIKSLPPVFGNLYRRLPNAVPGGVEFVHVDSLANRVCREAGVVPPLDPASINRAFDAAWSDVVRPGTPLQTSGLTKFYLRDEVREVIKGAGIDSLDEYLAMERTGRRTRFTPANAPSDMGTPRRLGRQTVGCQSEGLPGRGENGPGSGAQATGTHLRVSHSRRRAGLHACRSAVRSGPGDAGRTTRHAERTVHRWRRRPEDLPRRFHPRASRHRRPRQQFGSSRQLPQQPRDSSRLRWRCTGSEQVNDLEESYRRGDDEVRGVTTHEGVRPCLVRGSDFGGQIRFIADTAKRFADSAGLDLGDIGVLAPTNKLAERTQGGLEAMDLDCQPLASFDGTSTNRIKVGTFKRANGPRVQGRLPFSDWRPTPSLGPGATGKRPRSMRSGGPLRRQSCSLP